MPCCTSTTVTAPLWKSIRLTRAPSPQPLVKQIARFIRSITPVALRRLICRTGEYFGRGVDVQYPSIEGSLGTLHRLGLRPRFCIDVGACDGDWTQMFKSIFPDARVLMIEAQENKRPILQAVASSCPGDIGVEIALLGPTEGQAVTFMEMNTGSSVFPEASSCPRRAVEKTTRSLDALLASGKHPAADFLKLDVQGYELEVLKGAATTLRGVSAVLMEASFVPVNAGCPLISEVIAFMDSSGFRLFDFCSQIRITHGVLWQTDLLFVRTDSAVLPPAKL